ncbi:MgtC/SapB family protein [Paludibacterium purpuratum]|uniref:Protein MgtC n=1 Tax=Paludibacterium purpuratum TaxID=1144873 RepID=A0A4V3DUB7_9NEIS|nr:MgtC/SapB family protein [Paludibacterium purpuratum]TDR72059.1 putative Mg2+ transporter-C (MgtC) family protein [Paludibacterium purpuratum]
MQTLFNFSLSPFLHSALALVTAFVFGSSIGYERQVRQRTAGLRTNALVAVGAAAFVDMALRLTGADGAVRVVSYVVSGVGFLGAGTIMKDGLNVRGLNTAATLWGSAAAGACAGAGLYDSALLATLAVLSANTLLRPVVDSINRKPLHDRDSEVTYQLCVITTSNEQQLARAMVEELLEQAQYPVGDLDVDPFGDDDVELTATLLCTSADSAELDRIAERLSAKAYIKQAFWNPSTTE